MRYTALPFLLLALPAFAQYDGPESVEYDPVGDRYFVSNTGDNTIKQRAQDGTVTPFVSLTQAPYGLELRNDTLYACTGGIVRAFRASDATPLFTVNVGGTFLNGIACDERYVYTTDFSGGRIYKVDPAAGTFTTLVASTGGQPNGIVYDPVANVLRVVFWGSNAKIKAYDRESGAQVSTFTTALTNIDGIAIDCNGNICVSSWTPARISAFEPTFTQAPVNLGVTGISSPADLDFDEVHHVVCIPCSGNDAVVLWDIDCSSGINNAGYRSFTVAPDPTDGLLRVDLPLSAPTPFIVFDVRGLLVASGTLTPGAFIDLSELKAGTYVLDLPSLRRFARVVKY